MVKPWLFLPAPLSYKLGHLAIRTYGHFKPYKTLTWSPFSWKDLEFTNPLGIAGGVDKDAETLRDWWSFGTGFVEVGTVTPKPQKILDSPNLDRDVKTLAVWNKMGFPSKGVDYVKQRLQSLSRPHFTPVFVNIGKNRDTPMEEAYKDYVTCLEKLSGLADVFVVNISSPNTKGLRDLLKPDNFRKFLKPIIEKNNELVSTETMGRPTPLLVKLSPDLLEEELKPVLETGLELGVDHVRTWSCYRGGEKA